MRPGAVRLPSCSFTRTGFLCPANASLLPLAAFRALGLPSPSPYDSNIRGPMVSNGHALICNVCVAGFPTRHLCMARASCSFSGRSDAPLSTPHAVVPLTRRCHAARRLLRSSRFGLEHFDCCCSLRTLHFHDITLANLPNRLAPPNTLFDDVTLPLLRFAFDEKFPGHDERFFFHKL